MRILIVEDHADISHEIRSQLQRSGFAADVAPSIAAAAEHIDANRYALALLDRKLPDGDGIEIVPTMRKAQPGIRIMMLTALDALCDRVSGLDAGADDYLTKPFEPDELMARIRAVLRRPGGEPGPTIVLGNLSFDPGSREVCIADRPLVVPYRELTLLEALLQRAGRVAQRDALFSEVFGGADKVNWNSLNVLVSQLRHRLKEAGANVDIHSARRVGYFITHANA